MQSKEQEEIKTKHTKQKFPSEVSRKCRAKERKKEMNGWMHEWKKVREKERRKFHLGNSLYVNRIAYLF